MGIELGPLVLALTNALQLGLLVWLQREQSRVKKELAAVNGNVASTLNEIQRNTSRP